MSRSAMNDSMPSTMPSASSSLRSRCALTRSRTTCQDDRSRLPIERIDAKDQDVGRRGDLGGLAEPISASVETGALDNQCLQGGRVDGVSLMEIDSTYCLAVQTRVEEALRILQLGALWKCQPHGVLEGLADADDAVVGPDGDSLGAGGLLPLHLLDHAWIGISDQSPQLG